MLKNLLMFDLKFWKKVSRKLKSFMLGIATVTLCTVILASCTKAEAPLRVGANVWPGYETLYLARSLGYYDNTPIRLVDYPSGTEEVRAYRNGEIEAAGISIDQALVLAATNPDVKIVVVMDFSNGGDVILGKPEIPNLQGLKNRPVGVESTALGAFIITRALEQKGMSPKDIKIVSLGVSEHERAFKDGKVDAVVTFGYARTKLLAVGAKQLFDSSQIPGEIVDVLIVRDDVINKQPKALQALVDGRFRALDYLTKNPQDAAIRIAPRTGVTPEQFLESLKGLSSPSLQENQKLLGKTDPSLLNGVKRLSQVMLENKLLPKAVNPAPLLDDRLVKKVKY
ncbi:MAG: ABC transporter substrate-binding protein [Microcoleus sp. PH2017_01_SCD_O_A]|uniref:ABC transporter substrate-binding protein n=1 Tax=unclassified Microcoleus TaxID=2642155 RepID=UPI001DB8639E|nr:MULTISPECIES: ABC transporter substrate-binding protein [unclassified Microcoleus]MCC3509879.1 ABC transporter substrate-binding protein [Microcoleus sp. PH2017_17_BER_D_A]MCC3423551.1 ABC transporter substrate-binding protein [Microcoleus sp. PH2017_01_SCD_O_A]MCC3452013.1 ABC transporter substrate-binding protein [Microcoleus sp. PH2017_08_TRC_O_A]MCC3470597.1 ABC transporter substrate-binding protein [Microcoleus sp. PH2017_13_LAR_U_A]MCC3483122.1 ABC transporter substrate-binding protei